MIREILKYGNPILNKKSTKVEVIDENILNLIKDMKETMETVDGIGLAAAQIGVNKRIFVSKIEDIYKVFINPEIIETFNEKIIFEEGCLSIPDIYEKVNRERKIKVKYLNKKSKFTTEILEDIWAVNFQHEYDHLEGILFVEKISSLKKNLLRGRLKKMERQTKKDMLEKE